MKAKDLWTRCSVWMMAIGFLFCFFLTAGPVGASNGEGPIKIGFVGVLSGVTGSLGSGALKGVEYFVDVTNKAGGLLGRKLTLVVRDSQSKPAEAVNLVRSLILEEKVDLIITAEGSSAMLAMTPPANQYKKLIFHVTGGSQVFQNECNRYAFKYSEPGQAYAYASALMMGKAKPEITKWAGLIPDYEWGRSAWKDFEKLIKKYNPKAEIVGAAFPPFRATDFRPYATELMRLKPEGVYSILWSGDQVNFIKQAKLVGFFNSIKVYMDSSATLMDDMMDLGKEGVEVWGPTWYFFGYPDTPGNKEFVQGFRKKYNEYPNCEAGIGYRSCLILKAAIDKANSVDSEKLADVLPGLKVNTPLGNGYIRAKDHIHVPEVIVGGRTAFDQALGFYSIKEIVVVPGEDGYQTLDEVKGCIK